MGDTKMDKAGDLIDYNEVDSDGNPIAKSNEGTHSPEDLDWTFDDDQKAQF